MKAVRHACMHARTVLALESSRVVIMSRSSLATALWSAVVCVGPKALMSALHEASATIAALVSNCVASKKGVQPKLHRRLGSHLRNGNGDDDDNDSNINEQLVETQTRGLQQQQCVA